MGREKALGKKITGKEGKRKWRGKDLSVWLFVTLFAADFLTPQLTASFVVVVVVVVVLCFVVSLLLIVFLFYLLICGSDGVGGIVAALLWL